MEMKINQLLQGKSFDELVEIYEGFTAKEFNLQIENAIVNKMEQVDFERFIKWAE